MEANHLEVTLDWIEQALDAAEEIPRGLNVVMSIDDLPENDLRELWARYEKTDPRVTLGLITRTIISSRLIVTVKRDCEGPVVMLSGRKPDVPEVTW